MKKEEREYRTRERETEITPQNWVLNRIDFLIYFYIFLKKKQDTYYIELFLLLYSAMNNALNILFNFG